MVLTLPPTVSCGHRATKHGDGRATAQSIAAMRPLAIVELQKAIERALQRSAAGEVLPPKRNPPMLVQDRFLEALDEAVGPRVTRFRPRDANAQALTARGEDAWNVSSDNRSPGRSASTWRPTCRWVRSVSNPATRLASLRMHAVRAVLLQSRTQPIEHRPRHSMPTAGFTDIAQPLGVAQHAQPLNVYAVFEGHWLIPLHVSRPRETRGRIGQLALVSSLSTDDSMCQH